jgi:hypoxanthine phosphoribosyltransferase
LQQSSLKNRLPDVVSFDQDSFDEACAALMHLVLQDARPDLLIGIRTGGVHVAQSMAKALGFSLPVLSVTCRRSSTAAKSRLGPLKMLIARLPRVLVDRMRVIEHKILTQKPSRARFETFTFDPAELAVLDDWVRAADPNPSIVVVDDAVDSGTTLALVLDAVARRSPGAILRSAVITVTTEGPMVMPRYTLYRRQLCRFPWSLDG